MLYLQTHVMLQMLYIRTQVTLQWNLCDARMFKCRNKSRVQCVNCVWSRISKTYNCGYPRHTTSCLKVEPIIVQNSFVVDLMDSQDKKALTSKKTDRFYDYCKCTVESEIGWNLRYVLVWQNICWIKPHPTSVLVLPGQVMLGSASLHPISLVLAQQIWCWTREKLTSYYSLWLIGVEFDRISWQWPQMLPKFGVAVGTPWSKNRKSKN